MMLVPRDFLYLQICLGGFFFGLYSGIFAMYLQHVGSRRSTDKGKNIIFYALWVLYVLSAANMVVGILQFSGAIRVHYYNMKLDIIFACCSFVAHFILIYRCWIMWGYSVRVVILPSFLAFAFLALWVASAAAVQDQIYTPPLPTITLKVAGLTISMTVNALVTGLIVFRIFKVFQEVKTCTAADEQILGVTGGSRLQRVIFILIESGMALFSIQLARLVVTIVIVTTDAGASANASYALYHLVVSIHAMLTGITPTIILVRVSMGLSFHDESSMVEAASAGGFFRFQVPDISSPIPENAIVDEGRRHDDFENQLGYTDGRQVN